MIISGKFCAKMNSEKDEIAKSSGDLGVENVDIEKKEGVEDEEEEDTPYPYYVFFILGNEFCERYAYYGMRSILVIFLVSLLIINSIIKVFGEVNSDTTAVKDSLAARTAL